MNLALVSSRFPWPTHTGDRLRASIWLDALDSHATVSLIAPPGHLPAERQATRYFPAGPSRLRQLQRTATIVRRGLPFQTLLTAACDWSGAMEAARARHGAFDAVVVILERLDPWIRPALGKATTLLDAVDSLRVSAEERSRAASSLLRPLWREEERRLAAFERNISHLYDHIVVVSEEESGEFNGKATVIANSVSLAPLDRAAPRRYDFGFWGRLPYFVNADAVAWLLNEIIPQIRRLAPASRFVIGGAEASGALRRAAAEAGVTLISPIDSVEALAREVSVAVMPLRYGSGQSSKLLEAAEGGCAIVTTAMAIRGLPRLAPHVRLADDAPSIAAAAVSLLNDESERRLLSLSSRRAVEEHHDRKRAHEFMRRIIGAGPNSHAVPQ